MMKLHELRAKKGLNQWDLRLLTGIHQSKISLFESGYILPTDEEQQRLTSALGIASGELVFTLKSFAGSHLPTDKTEQKNKGGIAP